MSNTTQAPRPAAVDLDAARVHAAGLMRMGKPEAAWEINALVADLAATRAERDAALAASAALVRTLDAHTVLLESCDRDGQAYCDCLDAPLSRARALAPAPAPVPAAAAADPVTVPDVPAFLAGRVNGGAS